MSEANTISRRNKRTIGILVAILLILGSLHFLGVCRSQAPFELLAQEFYHIDEQGLHWDYDKILAAYKASRNSRRMQQLLDLMVISKAAHLTPDIIDSIQPGGFMNTERRIRGISQLTGHDFSEDFDITGIWQRPDVAKAKRRLHEWWAQNGEGILKTRGPKDSFSLPNHWSNLSLSLATEKDRYLEVEPVRLSAVLNNNSDVWFTFDYKLGKPAFAIEFLQVVDDKTTVKLAEVRYPMHWAVCGHTRRWFRRPNYFILDPNECHVMQQWVNHEYENTLSPGKTVIRAVLIPLRGKHKGKRLVSNDLLLDIVTPVGQDAAAHRFLTRRGVVDVGNGKKYGPGFLRSSGLIYTSGSHHTEPLNEYFLDQYPESIYANYVRYTRASLAKINIRSFSSSQPLTNREIEASLQLVENLEQIVSNAPRDFPLLADAYVMLLEYYEATGELDEMARVADTAKSSELRVLNPAISKKLADLTTHVDKVLKKLHQKSDRGRTLLHDAAEKGPPALVRFLIANGAEVDAQSDWGTPLCVAAQAERQEIVEILVDSGADVNAKNDGHTPLYWAVCKGQKEMVQFLLANGAEVNEAGRNGKTLAESAHLYKQLGILEILIKTRGQGGKTPLHWAVEHGRRSMVQMLLGYGADVNAEDDAGRTPLDLATPLALEDTMRTSILLLLQEYAQKNRSSQP